MVDQGNKFRVDTFLDPIKEHRVASVPQIPGREKEIEAIELAFRLAKRLATNVSGMADIDLIFEQEMNGYREKQGNDSSA
ncbi:MAG: hypothetical protein H6791_01335 [Candidatus Nomurabacteria bacterium]|nr:MAG: hypothetical protein H6791_01335 [Candidatus Nomurabacteria bacterium]